MRECKRVRRLLSSYIDQETSRPDTVLVEAHLGNCPVCQRDLGGFIRLKKLLFERERKSFPPDYLILNLRREVAGNGCLDGQWLLGLTSMANLSRRLIPIPAVVIALSFVFLISNFGEQADKYSLEDKILKGMPMTTESALELILGS